MNSPKKSKASFPVRQSIEVGCTLLIFFVVYGTPPPEINEAQYLTKAKHFWDPEFCKSDHFLNSGNAHWLFYSTIGAFTSLFSLPLTAWIGRMVGWTFIAWSWRQLVVKISDIPGTAVISAGVWLFLIRHFNLAGEWIVGGIEAKVVAYGFVFCGLADLIEGRWGRVWIYFGLASAFHVLVGGWSVIAALLAYAVSGRREVPIGRLLLPLAIGGTFSMAGVVPILETAAAASPQETAEAARIYVFDRLQHHLVFRQFPRESVLRFFTLTLIWCSTAWFFRHDAKQKRFSLFVAGSLAIAACGILLDLSIQDETLAAQVLRFYWFRLSDVMVPIGCAVLFCRFIQSETTRTRTVATAVALVYVLLSATSVMLANGFDTYPAADKQGWVRSKEQYVQWIQLCTWIKNNTEPDEVAFAPPNHQTFKWNAQRAEVVTWKDIPQDPKNILEWRRRLREIRIFLYRGSRRPIAYTNHALAELAKKYGFRFAIIEKRRNIPRLNHVVAYEDEYYTVYLVQ